MTNPQPSVGLNSDTYPHRFDLYFSFNCPLTSVATKRMINPSCCLHSTEPFTFLYPNIITIFSDQRYFIKPRNQNFLASFAY